MVRQWQQLLHGNRLSESYTEALPDFVKLADAYGWTGMRCDNPADLDDAIKEMINTKGPVMFDCRVAKLANCFPMIPSGKAHNEMLLGEDVSDAGGRARYQRRRQGAGVSDRMNVRCAAVAASCSALLVALSVASPAATAKEDWNHVANIKDAATRLADTSQARGLAGRAEVPRRLLQDPASGQRSSRKASSHAWRRTTCIRRSWRSDLRAYS